MGVIDLRVYLVDSVVFRLCNLIRQGQVMLDSFTMVLYNRLNNSNDRDIILGVLNYMTVISYTYT